MIRFVAKMNNFAACKECEAIALELREACADAWISSDEESRDAWIATYKLIPAEMPVKVCRRCEKLFASDLKSAEFCSSQCREKSFWTSDRKRDYNKVCRWETHAANSVKQENGFTLADLNRLKKITGKKNALDNIAFRWKDWTKIAEKVDRIREALKGAK